MISIVLFCKYSIEICDRIRMSGYDDPSGTNLLQIMTVTKQKLLTLLLPCLCSEISKSIMY